MFMCEPAWPFVIGIAICEIVKRSGLAQAGQIAESALLASRVTAVTRDSDSDRPVLAPLHQRYEAVVLVRWARVGRGLQELSYQILDKRNTTGPTMSHQGSVANGFQAHSLGCGSPGAYLSQSCSVGGPTSAQSAL